MSLRSRSYLKPYRKKSTTKLSNLLKPTLLVAGVSIFSHSAYGAEIESSNVNSNKVKQIKTANPSESANKIESRGVNKAYVAELNTELQSLEIDNSIAVSAAEEGIENLKGSYISPYNYIQDPIAFNMGLSSVAGPSGTYHVGLSSINSNNMFLDSQNSSRFVDSVEAWGQTGRFKGFAIGGGVIGAFSAVQNGQPNTFSGTGILSPSQAYIDYQYKDVFQITGGNILLSTPWVNSISSFPGATYANLNNNYQGVTANFQASPTLLLTGFRAFTYLQYPNSWFDYGNLYNTFGGPLANMTVTGTSGTDGVGAIWNPSEQYKLNLWFYQFIDYADMWYADNSYNLKLSNDTSMDFAIQALNQASNGSSITSSTLAPGSTTQYLGGVNGNAVGAKINFNVPHNTFTIAYNSVFGTSNSYMNGGIVTPYTYGLETDPLYTTPALSSIAEFGSGNAYLIKDSMKFLDNKLKASLAFSQFFVNKVYSFQPNQVTEYDASLQYNIPHTNLNVWSRLVYLQQPDYSGGDLLQPRLIVNYTF